MTTDVSVQSNLKEIKRLQREVKKWKTKYEKLNEIVEDHRALLIQRGQDSTYMILVDKLSAMKLNK